MWPRALAGIVAGFFLSAGIVGLVSWLLPGPWQSTIVGAAIAFLPLWMGLIAASFAFRDGRRAWLWLGTPALLSLALLHALQAVHWVE